MKGIKWYPCDSDVDVITEIDPNFQFVDLRKYINKEELKLKLKNLYSNARNLNHFMLEILKLLEE